MAGDVFPVLGKLFDAPEARTALGDAVHAAGAEFRDYFRSSVTKIQRLDPELGEAAMRYGAATDNVPVWQRQFKAELTSNLAPEKQKLAGLILQEARRQSALMKPQWRVEDAQAALSKFDQDSGLNPQEMAPELAATRTKLTTEIQNAQKGLADFQKDGWKAIRIPGLSAEQHKLVANDSELQDFIKRYKTSFQPELEHRNALLGVANPERPSPFHGLFVNLRPVTLKPEAVAKFAQEGLTPDDILAKFDKGEIDPEMFGGRFSAPMYWDPEKNESVEVAVNDAGSPVIPRSNNRAYKGPAASEHMRLLNASAATGTAHAYETDVDHLIDHLVRDRWPAAEKAKFINLAQAKGWAVPLDKAIRIGPNEFRFDIKQNLHDPNSPTIPTAHEGRVWETNAQVGTRNAGWDATTAAQADHSDMAESLHRSSKPFVAPRHMLDAIKDIEQSLEHSPGALSTALSKVGAGATYMQLAFAPTAGIRHALRVVSILKTLPMAADDKVGLALKLTGSLGGFVNALREIPMRSASDEGAKMFQTLLDHGGLRVHSFEGAADVEKSGGPFKIIHQVLFGDPREAPEKWPSFLKNYYGLDSRARVAAALLYKSYKPTATAGELADFARQFGNYHAALQPQWVRTARKYGATFAGFEYQAIPTEIARALGVHGMDVSSLPVVQRRLLNGLTLWNGLLGSTISAAFLTKMLAGYFPWEKKGKGLPFGAIAFKGPDGVERMLPLSDIDPAAARAAAFLGIRAAFEGKGPQWDWANEGLALAGPAARDIIAAGLGRDLFFTPEGALQPLAPTMANPTQQLQQDVLARGAALGGPLFQGLYNVSQLAPGAPVTQGKNVAGNPAFNTLLASLGAATGEHVYPTAPHGAQVLALKQGKAGAAQAIKHAQEQAVAAAQVGSPDEIRARLKEIQANTPPQFLKSAMRAFKMTLRSQLGIRSTAQADGNDQ